MWSYPKTYDVIVIGAGHAGCEAAYIAAKLKASVLLITSNLDTIAKLSCNPAIGGIGKGHIVREIDALGGIMPSIIDSTGIQFRMLNHAKGPAVRAPRAQADKLLYHLEMKKVLETLPNLHIFQSSVSNLIIKEDSIVGVITKEHISFLGRSVVLSSGTFMQGSIHIGKILYSGGRAGDPADTSLSSVLKKYGFKLDRLKTGTPARVNASSINFSEMIEQQGDSNICFRHGIHDFFPRLPQKSCWITYTTPQTQEIVEKNLEKSALYSGNITGVGPRYCPSIEDKVVRFADKTRHQIFLEPEGIHTQEFYVNGLSTSLPFDVQYELLRSVSGLESAVITRPAYAIEYDYICSGQIHASLETKIISNLFFCGQINGTTGYEEAAAQGLIAGINAVLKIRNQKEFVPKRHESYIGVMIDDLTTRQLDEPYRMFTSRAEYRLLLRQDNSQLRLTHYAYQLGLKSLEEHLLVNKQKEIIEQEKKRLGKTFIKEGPHNISLAQFLRRPEISYQNLLQNFPETILDYGNELNNFIEIEIKYAGYLERQKTTIEKQILAEELLLPKEMDYSTILGLSLEAQEKFKKFTPATIGAASRLPGIAVADIQVLIIALKKNAYKQM